MRPSTFPVDGGLWQWVVTLIKLKWSHPVLMNEIFEAGNGHPAEVPPTTLRLLLGLTHDHVVILKDINLPTG